MLHHQQTFYMGGIALQQVTYGAIGAGANDASPSPLSVPYPSGIVARSFLVLCVVISGAGSITTPSDWTLAGDLNSGRIAVFWKIATGAESGSLDVTYSAAGGAMGRMLRFSHGSGIESFDSQYLTSDATKIAPEDITASPKACAVCVVGVQGTSVTMNSRTGESGGDMTEIDAEYHASPAGHTIGFQQAEMASGGTLSGGTIGTWTATNPLWTFTFAITP